MLENYDSHNQQQENTGFVVMTSKYTFRDSQVCDILIHDGLASTQHSVQYIASMDSESSYTGRILDNLT